MSIIALSLLMLTPSLGNDAVLVAAFMTPSPYQLPRMQSKPHRICLSREQATPTASAPRARSSAAVPKGSDEGEVSRMPTKEATSTEETTTPLAVAARRRRLLINWLSFHLADLTSIRPPDPFANPLAPHASISSGSSYMRLWTHKTWAWHPPPPPSAIPPARPAVVPQHNDEEGASHICNVGNLLLISGLCFEHCHLRPISPLGGSGRGGGWRPWGGSPSHWP